MTVEPVWHAWRDGPAVYVLKCSGSEPYLYKGACRNLPDRLKSHWSGKVSRTRNRRPLELIYVEYMPDYGAALKRERFLKSGAGREFLKEKLKT